MVYLTNVVPTRREKMEMFVRLFPLSCPLLRPQAHGQAPHRLGKVLARVKKAIATLKGWGNGFGVSVSNVKEESSPKDEWCIYTALGNRMYLTGLSVL